MSDWYVVDQRGHRVGPISSDQVAQMITAGTLSAQSLAWTEALGENWTPLKETQFSDLTRKQPPPLPPANRQNPRNFEREVTIDSYERQLQRPLQEKKGKTFAKFEEKEFNIIEFLQCKNTKEKIKYNYQRYLEIYNSNKNLKSSYLNDADASNQIKFIVSWNWSAFLFGIYWWIWRGLPNWQIFATLYMAFSLGNIIFVGSHENKILNFILYSPIADILISFVINFGMGLYGNSFYLAHLIRTKSDNFGTYQPNFVRLICYILLLIMAVVLLFRNSYS